MKILIAEDEIDSRVFLERRLKKQGYIVYAAVNGADALAIAQETKPDIVISDIMMPEMDGFELCRRMKADEELRTVPFVFYTATFLDSKDEQLAMALGGERFIAKPIEIEQLLEIIHEVLEKPEQETLSLADQPENIQEQLATMYSETIGRKLDKKIKELEQEHQALKRSEQKYRSLVEGLKDEYFFYSHNTKGIFTYLSPSITNVLGYSKEEFLTHYMDFFTDNSLNIEAERQTKLSIKGQKQAPYELEIYHKDGSIRILEVKENPIVDNRGEVIAIEGIAHDITDRKKSEKQYRLLADNSADVIWTMDKELNITYVSPSIKQLRGYTPEETIAEPFEEKFAPSSLEKVRELIAKTSQSNTPVYFEGEQPCKDGSTVWVEMSVRSLIDDSGDRIGLIGTSRNITERKKSEKRYQTLFNGAPDAILILMGPDLTIKDCNKKSLETFSCKAEDIDGKTPFEISPQQQLDGKNSKDEMLKIISTLLESQQPLTFEWQYQRFNGEVFDAEVSLGVLEHGPEVTIQAIVRDITERKRLDDQVRLLQQWIEHSVDLFFWVRDDSQILYVNQAVCDSLGYTLEELCSMKVGDFDLEITVEAWPKFTTKLRSQGSLCFESRLRKKNGEDFPVEITIYFLEFEGKDHYFAYGRDISAKIKAEKDQKAMEKQLAQAQKMEAIGTLAGGIAHDFNNILTTILGYTELAMINADNKQKAHSNLDKVLNGALRAKDLVKQILTFSRKNDQELQPLKIQLIVTEALKLLRSSIPTTIAINQDIKQDCEAVLADPTHIHQIVMNLCTNAYHAMRESGGILGISLQTIELTSDVLEDKINLNPGTYLKLEVSDTGCGISNPDLDKIFEPYFTTKEKGEGTGLGLAIVHGIVSNIGGDVTVHSELGKGTNFQVYLPVTKNTQVAEQEKDTAAVLTGNERILLVDDDEAIVQAYKDILEHLGYKVTALSSSTITFDIFHSRPDDFDLVITDMTMPEMTGAELAKQILAIRPDIPIILCTGFSELIDEEKAKEIGIRGYVMKPVIKNDFAMTIRKVLDNC